MFILVFGTKYTGFELLFSLFSKTYRGVSDLSFTGSHSFPCVRRVGLGNPSLTFLFVKLKVLLHCNADFAHQSAVFGWRIIQQPNALDKNKGRHIHCCCVTVMDYPTWASIKSAQIDFHTL